MSIESIEADLELQYEATLGECPVWDEQENRLYWVDILSGTLFKYDPGQKENEVFNIGEHIGSFALREESGAVLALKTGFALYSFDSNRLNHLTNPESHLPNHRFNDGKCDPSGRFWAGTLSYDQQECVGSLYNLNSNLSVDHKLGKVTIPNGMAWDSDRKTFYFIDSWDRTIYAYDFDNKNGIIENRSVIKKFENPDILPDGMTIDTEGYLWVALYNGFKVVRIDPGSGTVDFEVSLPVPQVTSCTFGGSNFNELYITTAREHMTEKDIAKAPLSGSLFRAEVPFSGTPADRFKG